MASIAVTGNGSRACVVVDQADEFLQPVDGQVGLALFGGQFDARHATQGAISPAEMRNHAARRPTICTLCLAIAP